MATLDDLLYATLPLNRRSVITRGPFFRRCCARTRCVIWTVLVYPTYLISGLWMSAMTRTTALSCSSPNTASSSRRLGR